MKTGIEHVLRSQQAHGIEVFLLCGGVYVYILESLGKRQSKACDVSSKQVF